MSKKDYFGSKSKIIIQTLLPPAAGGFSFSPWFKLNDYRECARPYSHWNYWLMQILRNMEQNKTYILYIHSKNVLAPLSKWRHARRDASIGGTSTHFTQLFKNVFLRINLDQNMPKNVCFWKKSSIIAASPHRRGSAPEPSWSLAAGDRGGATEKTRRAVPSTLHKGHFYFCNRLKPMRKYWEYGGEGGSRHQPYLNFSLSLSQVIFKDRI